MNDLTREKILKIAFKEFLQKGFENTSLRNIAKLSNLTTGAIYGYFNGKSDIFDSLVKEASLGLYDIMNNSIKDFFENDIENQILNFGQNVEKTVFPLVDYIFAHYDEFQLIFLKSKGTEYQYYIDRFVDLEIKNTIAFVDYLVENKKIDNRPTDTVISILSEHSVLSMFEVLTIGLSIEEAKEQVVYISNFYYTGWLNIIKK